MTLADQVAELVLKAKADDGKIDPAELEALDDVADAIRRLRVLNAVAVRLRRPGMTVRAASEGVARVEGFSPHTIRSWWYGATVDERSIQIHADDGPEP